LSIGTVTTTTEPSVTITGTAENPVLNFGLVKGDKGDTGEVSQAEFDAAITDVKSALRTIIQTVTWNIETAPVVDNVLWTVLTGNSFKVNNATNNILSFRFVDVSNTILQETNIAANTETTVVSTVNADHIRMFVNGTGTITVTSLDSRFETLSKDVEGLKGTYTNKNDISENIFKGKTEYTEDDFTVSPGYINQWGTISNASGTLGYTYTNAINLKEGDKIFFESAHLNYANICTIAKYVSAGNYVTLVMGESDKGSYQYTVNSDGKYAFCFNTNVVVTIISPSVIDAEIKALKNRVDYLTLFKNVVCLGDSLTRGYNSTYSEGQRNRDFGYPWVLARETRLNVYNYGHSGATPSTLYSELSSADFSMFDMAIICLGRNGGVESAEDQTAYQNLIDKLLTDNEHMTIFICSLPAYGDTISASDEAINARIETIAENNNLPYLDLWGSYGSAEYRTGDAHFKPVGYILMAETIIKQIDSYIENNIADYINLWMPKTLPDYINGEVE